MSRAWRLRAVDLFCVAAAALLLPSTPWGHPSAVGFALLLVAIGFSNAALIHVTIARQRVSFTLTEGLLAGAYLMAPGSWIIIPAVVGLIPLLVINKSSALKIQHNVAQYIVATSLASYVVYALHNTIPACIVGMTAWWVASQIMSAIPLSIMSGERFRKMVFEYAALQAVHAGGTMSIGLLAAWLAVNAPFGLPSSSRAAVARSRIFRSCGWDLRPGTPSRRPMPDRVCTGLAASAMRSNGDGSVGMRRVGSWRAASVYLTT